MPHYLICEKVPQQHEQAYQNIETRVPSFTNAITVVEADNVEEAVRLHISATSRVSKYAVVECEFVDFQLNGETDSKAGVIRKKPVDEKRRLKRSNDDDDSALD